MDGEVGGELCWVFRCFIFVFIIIAVVSFGYVQSYDEGRKGSRIRQRVVYTR